MGFGRKGSRYLRFTVRRLGTVAFCVLTFITAAFAGEQQTAKEGVSERSQRWIEENADFREWGKLGKPLRGFKNYYEITLYRKVDRSGKVIREKALLKIPHSVLVYRDARIRMKDLKPKERLLVFGERSTVRAVAPGAAEASTDRQVLRPRVLLTGQIEKAFIQRAYKDRFQPKHEWCDVAVVKTAGGLVVNHRKHDYRITIPKGVPILRRGPGARKELENKRFVRVFAREIVDRPKFKRAQDERRECYGALMLVVLDPKSMKAAYPLIWAK